MAFTFCGAPVSQNKALKKKGKAKSFIISFLIALTCIMGFFLYKARSENYIGTEKGTQLSEDEADQKLFSDITDEEWQVFEDANAKLEDAVRRCSEDDGYISSDKVTKAINTVAAEVDSLYSGGDVSYYACDEEGVYFEYSSGIGGLYTPTLKDTSSGRGEIDIVALDPFKTDPTNGTMTDQAYQSGKVIQDAFSSNTGYYNTTALEHYADDEVTVDLLKDLLTTDLLLWNGHGKYIKKIYGRTFPVLLTGEKTTNGIIGTAKVASTPWRISEVLCDIGENSYWAITPHFVKEHLSLNNGLVYLSACQSGRNDYLASAFIEAGAETVFVNVGEQNVKTEYTQNMMKLIIGYMSGVTDGIYHTAGEALELANKDYEELLNKAQNSDLSAITSDSAIVTMSTDTCGEVSITVNKNEQYDDLTDYLNWLQGGTKVQVKGNGTYTLCAGIHGIVSFDDTDMSDSEIADIEVTLYDKNGTLAKSTSVSDDSEFYFNNIEPGDYSISLVYEGEETTESVSVSVNEHRYSEVDVPYSLQSSVANNETYWVIFREGFRNSRIEKTEVTSPVNKAELYIVWNSSMKLNNTSDQGIICQYHLTDEGKWEYDREYNVLTDWATEVIASNLDVRDADGNLILKATDKEPALTTDP